MRTIMLSLSLVLALSAFGCIKAEPAPPVIPDLPGCPPQQPGTVPPLPHACQG